MQPGIDVHRRRSRDTSRVARRTTREMQFPPDPPRPDEIIVVMRQAGHDRHGLRLRALITVLWRAGLRISEALALNETDIDVARNNSVIPGYADRRCHISHAA
jgi:integrase